MIFGAKKSSAAIHHHNLNMHSANNNFGYDQQSASSGDYPYQMQRQMSDAAIEQHNNWEHSQIMNGSHTTKPNHTMARQDYFSMVVP